MTTATILALIFISPLWVLLLFFLVVTYIGILKDEGEPADSFATISVAYLLASAALLHFVF